jgi:hypothetical protein
MFREAGASAALSYFGVKEAGDWDEYLRELQQQAVGTPGEAWKQFRKGTLLKPGKGLISKGLPRNASQLAAAMAWPVLGSFLNARNNPDAGAGELAGDFLGRSVGSLVGAPIGGAVGQVGGGMFLAPVGQAVGKSFDSSPGTDVVPDE